MNHDDKHTLSLMEKYPKTKKVANVKNANLKPKVTPVSKRPRKVRKQSTTIKTKIRSILVKLLGVLLTLTLLFFGGRYLYDHTLNYNPLVGKWRAKTVMGIMEIEFDRNSISSFGSPRSVSYDVKEKEVIVMDNDIKIGEKYHIIDENTITLQSGASKITFLRVK